jgi:hypothetical protein
MTSTGRDEESSPVDAAARQGKSAVKAAEIKARDVADRQKASAAHYLHGVSKAATSGGKALGEEGHHQSAAWLDQAAAELDGWASALEGKSPAEILGEVESFAHRRPAVFFGAALLVGFGAVRFFKSGK